MVPHKGNVPLIILFWKERKEYGNRTNIWMDRSDSRNRVGYYRRIDRNVFQHQEYERPTRTRFYDSSQHRVLDFGHPLSRIDVYLTISTSLSTMDTLCNFSAVGHSCWKPYSEKNYGRRVRRSVLEALSHASDDRENRSQNKAALATRTITAHSERLVQFDRLGVCDCLLPVLAPGLHVVQKM